MNKKCQGCGTKLQTENQEKIGYIPQKKYNDTAYCERCFKIINYNQKVVTKLDNINEYIIEEVNKKAKVVYFLIDFLNINTETINTFKKIEVPKTLVISKLDIIPKSIKTAKISNWLLENYDIDNEIIFQSTKKSINTKKIISNLDNKEIYILGYTNAGKSTLINKISELNEIDNKKLTTSLIPNTTIDFIKINLNNNLIIIDSPGFTLQNTIYKENEFELIKKVNPKTFLKPTTYQVKEITSLLIEDKIRIQSSQKNSLTFYMSNDLEITRIFDKNNTLKEKEEIVLDIPENSDLVIKSIGFINIKKSCKLTINSDKKELFEIRKSMF